MALSAGKPTAVGVISEIGYMVAELSSSFSARSATGFLDLDHCHSSMDAILGKLLPLLAQMSQGFLSGRYRVVDTFLARVWCGYRQVQVPFADISALADLLFEELEGTMRNLTSFLGSPVLISLLRCCIKLLTPLGFNQSLVLKKCRILLALLSKLCSPEQASMLLFGDRDVTYWKRSISRECMVFTGGMIKSRIEVCNEFFDASAVGVDILCPMLEVFTDELLVNRDFQNYLTVTDSIACADDKLFKSQCTYGNITNVLEVVSAHFLLSFWDESAFTRFSRTLFWTCKGNLEPSELSLCSAMSLLGIIANAAAPCLLQAHVISLVSKSIGICMNLHGEKKDFDIYMNLYISAFEVSVGLYMKHMSDLDVISQHLKVDNSLDFLEKEWCTFGFDIPAAFESIVHPVTRGRVDLQCLKFKESCSPSFDKEFSSFDITSASVSYLEDLKPIFDPSFSKEISAILNCIILKCLSALTKENPLHGTKEESAEKICYLAALLKLMGCSLLQIVWQIRGSHNTCGLKTLKDYAHCREYDFIAGIIGSFKHWTSQIGSVASDAMGRHPEEYMTTKSMIIHFSGLLLFCYERGPEFLWKSCIFVLMVLINLLVFEEGNVDALKSTHEQPAAYCFRNFFKSKICQNVAMRKSSLLVASHMLRIKDKAFHKSSVLHALKMTKIKDATFQQPRRLVMSNRRIKDVESRKSSQLLVASNMRKIKVQLTRKPENADLMKRDHEDADNACNGESFIESILGLEENGKKPSDYEELTDFIVCKHGKDYKSWLKSRGIFRRWSYGKGAGERERKKKKLKRILRGLNDDESSHALS